MIFILYYYKNLAYYYLENKYIYFIKIIIVIGTLIFFVKYNYN